MKQTSILQSLLLSTLFYLICVPILSGQTTMQLENIINRADLIIIGEVTEISSSWDVEKTRIWTYVKIICEDNLKGKNNSGEIMIRVLGGKLMRLVWMYPGLQSLRFLNGLSAFYKMMLRICMPLLVGKKENILMKKVIG